jgi:hypothetical protein
MLDDAEVVAGRVVEAVEVGVHRAKVRELRRAQDGCYGRARGRVNVDSLARPWSMSRTAAPMSDG